MPKRKDLKKIMVIGSGPIVIGQGAEFDYAGTQACLALKEEGYQVILVNSNPATIMTDSKIDYNEAEEACCQTLDLLPSKINVFTTLDINQYGQELFFLSINNDGAKETYCVLINSDYEVFFANVENDFQMQIRQFKQENGWKKTE